MRRTCRIATGRLPGFAVVLTAALTLGACSSVPDALNPVEWYGGVERLFTGDPSQQHIEPPPAEGRTYPNLATVPKPPRIAPGAAAARAEEVEELTRNRDSTIDADRALRTAGTFPAAPPPPAQIEPVPTAPAQQRAPVVASRSYSPPVAAAPRPAQAAPSMAQAAPPSAAPPVRAMTSQRLESISFPPLGLVASSRVQTVLQQAASIAQARGGRVKVVPVTITRQTVQREFSQARRNAILQTLVQSGLSLDRIEIGDDLGRRVDLYDVLVEYPA